MKMKYTGLYVSEVENNQKLYGKNEIKYGEKKSLLKKIKLFVVQPIFIISILCTIMYIILNEFILAIIMGIIVLIILFNYIFQQLKLDKIKQMLYIKNSDRCTVIRDNKYVVINATELTIDDILVLSEGDKVNADAIILECNNMYADETNIIKNNKKVRKSFDLLDKDATLKSNYVYNGTFITKGNGIAKVISIGNKTEYGKKYIENQFSQNSSILENKVSKKYVFLLILSLIFFCLISAYSTIKNNNIILGILSGAIISVSIIPIVNRITFNLYINNFIYKLSKNNAIIKKTSTLDIINNISLLCVDKFGIITENNMIVKDFFPTIEKTKALLSCALACDDNDDLYETAIKKYLQDNNVLIDNEFKLIKKYPFTLETKIMANVYEYKNELYLCAKGTLNGLFDICNIDVENKYKLHNFQKKLFKNGMEVIAFASKKIKNIEEDIFKYDTDFNGLIGLYNPLKNNVENTIKKCEELAIKPLIICEDKKEIALYITKEIGCINNVIAGKELNKIDDNELINNIGVFSRINQEQKYRVINILKNNHDAIALTYSSHEDIEILRESDILISMNEMGTDYSRNNCDLIILDDNFTTIVNTIDSVKKMNLKIDKIIKQIILINILFCIVSLILLLLNRYIVFLPILIIILKFIIETFYIMKVKK